MRHKRLRIIIVVCFAASLAAIKTINDRVGREVYAITKPPRPVPSARIAPEASSAAKQGPSARRRKPGETIVRKDRLSPGRDYLESVFYLNDTPVGSLWEEVAQQKIVNEKVVESSGEIPEGRVDFLDESKKTYGTDYYLQGKKSGPSRTYLPDGRLNIEAYYQWGKLLWKKEYYNDGNIRLEVSYEDAREQSGEKETGAGKVYYRDGTIKYEWNLTNSEKVGFKKSYSQDGELRAASYFDEYGQPVE